jgi:hypothetical protein
MATANGIAVINTAWNATIYTSKKNTGMNQIISAMKYSKEQSCLLHGSIMEQ